jgi:acetoacetyl-CoA synthetase
VLVVHLEGDDGGLGELILFVQPAPGAAVDAALEGRIARALRSELSPRHVPDRVVAIGEIPRGRTGKRLEVPVKRILLGAEPESVLGPVDLAPATIATLTEMARRRQEEREHVQA